MIALIAVAHTDSATFATDEGLARFDREALWTTALQSLRHESIEEVIEKVAPLPGAETTFLIAFGLSTFMTSRLLGLPDFLEDAVGSPDAPHGVVVAMASRHQLAFHVARDSEFLYAVSGMADYVADCYASSKSPLSPNVYYWWPGGLDRLTFPGKTAEPKSAWRVRSWRRSCGSAEPDRRNPNGGWDRPRWRRP